MSNKNDIDAPVYHSRLRAKREERIKHRHQHTEAELHQPINPNDHVIDPRMCQLDTGSLNSDSRVGREATLTASVIGDGENYNSCSTSSRTARSNTDESRKRVRAEARRLVIEYPGTIWDVVRNNDTAMLRHFLIVEGAAKLVNAHCKDIAECGRTLLHTAAWWGAYDVAQILLSSGASVNAIDTSASRTTPLITAARAGHADMCVLFLCHGADATGRDLADDNAFHWAGRQNHGAVLLAMSLELETTDPSTLNDCWLARNGKGKSPVDYTRLNTFVFSLLQKRLGSKFPSEILGKRRSRFQVTTPIDSSGWGTAVAPGTTKEHLNPQHQANIAAEIRPSSHLEGESNTNTSSTHFIGTNSDTSTRRVSTCPNQTLSDVHTLGLDIESFAYKVRETNALLSR